MNRLLEKAVNPDGSKRFYPRGKHPATQRHREMLARLEELDDGSKTIAAAIDYHRGQIALFEFGEDRAKRDYLRAIE